MTDLEQRLRDELHRIGERADPGSIRPLRVPPARERSRLARWLAPAAAAVAVIGVITSVSLVGGPARRPPADREGRMPPYYVLVQESFAGSTGGFLDRAVVRDSVTGRALASIRLPGSGLVAISGAADGRTFVITDGNDLFRMRLAADGRSAQLSRLPITVANAFYHSVTLSPDGSTVAFESQSCVLFRCQYSAIQLVSLRTGATRTWSTRALTQLNSIWISWDGNDHVLFSWASTGAPPVRRSGYWLLDVSGPGGSLLAARKLPLPLPLMPGISGPGPLSEPRSAFITHDGSAVITSTFSAAGPSQRPTLVSTVVEQSARTGRVLRVLLRETSVGWRPIFGAHRDGCWVYSLGPTGVHALVGCFSPGYIFGRLDNGRFTPLPGFPGPAELVLADAAW
jgi:hypothetical protein